MLEVRDLTKRYGENLAVDGLSFKANAGRVLGFLGPNGAGKTTTLRMLLGLTLPTASPEVGRVRPSSMRSVVVLPAPFGPRKPRTRPAFALKLRPSTARFSP